MKLRILHGKPNSPARLPDPVFRYMQHRFIFLPEYLNSLRCFISRGTFEGKDVTHVRIFSPRKARIAGLVIDTGEDLELHPEMLLFEGHIGKGGDAYVADRRTPARNGSTVTNNRG